MVADEFDRIRDRVVASVETFWFLTRRTSRVFSFTFSAFSGVSVFEMTRDTGSLSQEEISLVIELMRSFFHDALVVDSTEGPLDEEHAVQEELIQEMLEDIREESASRKLIAFREEGRVLVFNK
jgi:hypothetical protein